MLRYALAIVVAQLVAAIAWGQESPSCDWESRGNSPCGNTCGDIRTNGNEVCAYNETTDAAPDNLILKSGDCYAQGTQTASNLVLGGGLDEKKITVDTTGGNEVGVTVTATVNGTALATLTEGVGFACSGLTDAQCATNLAAALTAQVGSGATCTGVAAVVYCQPTSCSTYALSYASADGGGGGVAFVVSNGTDGQVLLQYGSATSLALAFAGDSDTGFIRSATNTFAIYAGGSTSMRFLAGAANTAGGYLYNSTGMLDLGGAVTSTHALDATVGSVGISGALEVDGALFADSSLTVASNLTAQSYFIPLAITYGTINTYTDGGMYLSVGDGDGQGNRSLVIGSYANSSKDYDHDTLQANPTVYIHSVTDPDTNNTQWLSLAHDQTNGAIATGAGLLSLTPAAKGVVLPVLDAAVPAEPVACAAGTVGTLTYVNDNNDGAAAELCICAGITNDATFDWVQVKDMTTACSFF